MSKGDFPPPLLFLSVCAAASGQTLSLPCKVFGFHPKNPFLIPSPPFPALDVVIERLFFLGMFILLFCVR